MAENIMWTDHEQAARQLREVLGGAALDSEPAEAPSSVVQRAKEYSRIN